MERILELLGATAAAMDHQISDVGLVMMAEDLELYGVDVVEKALRQVRRECRRLSVADVVARIDDGRPGVEEAWGMIPRGESETVVWTAEMQAAYGAALPLLEEGDKVAARMAFKERYAVLLAAARSECVPVAWSASLGSDPLGREKALTAAVEAGRLQAGYARGLLPSLTFKPQAGGLALLDAVNRAAAALPAPDEVSGQRNAQRAADLLRECFGKPEYRPVPATRLVAVGSLSPCKTMRFVGGNPADPAAWVDSGIPRVSVNGEFQCVVEVNQGGV